MPGYRFVDRGRIVQPLVYLRQPGLGYSDAAVADLDQHAPARQGLDRDQYLGVAGGVHRGVLDELGKQMHDVGHRRPRDHAPGLDFQRHPVVLLDLRYRGAGHVAERNRFAPFPRTLVPGQQEEVLGVPAHPGDQVVHREQVGQPTGIFLVLFQGVDHSYQPLDQRLAPPGQADEHRVEASAQQRLVPGQPHRLRVHLVERAGDLADFIHGQHVDRRHLQARRGVRGLPEVPDPLRQLHRGDVERAFPQPAQRQDQRPGDGECRDEHEDQDHRHQDPDEQRGPFRAPLQDLGPRDDVSGYPQLDGLHSVDRVGHRRVPLARRGLRADVQGAVTDVQTAGADDVLLDIHGLPDQRPGHDAGESALLGRRGGRVERRRVSALPRRHGDQRLLLGVSEGSLRERVEEDRALLGDLILLQGQRVERLDVVGEGRIIGPLRDLAVQGQIAQGADDPALTNDVQTLNSLSLEKDQVAQQRAILFHAFTKRAFANAEQEALVTVAAGQGADATAFDATATPAEQSAFTRVVAGPLVRKAVNIEQYVVSTGSLDIGNGALNISAQAAPGQWYSAMSDTIDRMQTVELGVARNIVARAQVLQRGAERSALIIGILVAVIRILVLLATFALARSLVLPLRRLREGALDVAAVQLPERVRQLGETPDSATSLDVAPIDVTSADEIGQVARAFDQVHAEAVRLAGNEALLRRSFNAMFISLSRRSQSLIERLVRMIDSLEQNEEDPRRLSNLFTMDHLVTRMRRNSENLLLLAGHEGARKWSEPVPLSDVT